MSITISYNHTSGQNNEQVRERERERDTTDKKKKTKSDRYIIIISSIYQHPNIKTVYS